MRRSALCLTFLLATACGSRTTLDLFDPPPALLGAPVDAGLADVVQPVDAFEFHALDADTFGFDAGDDAFDADTFDAEDDTADADLGDSGVMVDASPPTYDGGACQEGENTEYPTEECSGDANWEASPYVPEVDITVDRIALYTTGGRIAVLAASAAGPGALLFTGSTAVTEEPAWLDISVNPPLALKGGQLYWLAQQSVTGYCSFAQGGPEDVEWDSNSLDGGWFIAGTDSWIARVYGTCPLPP